jgi:hypothetical protein
MSSTGILVVGYARPDLLWNLLESLRRQDALAMAHVWIDGTAGRAELATRVAETITVARSFPVAEVHQTQGHLGIEKLMLDALRVMAQAYRKIIVLEDDCFPVRDGIVQLRRTLGQADADPEIFSVYGHHFEVPGEGATFSRFQGWGWATTRAKLLPVLDENIRLFSLPEADYLAYIRASLTDEIRARLDVTPGRDVLRVLEMMYSWDSCTAFITAQRRQLHCKTARPAVRNCGLTAGIGHFDAATSRFRDPPFNMVSPEEVWGVW